MLLEVLREEERYSEARYFDDSPYLSWNLLMNVLMKRRTILKGEEMSRSRKASQLEAQGALDIVLLSWRSDW